VLHRTCLRCSQAFPEVFFSQSVPAPGQNVFGLARRQLPRRYRKSGTASAGAASDSSGPLGATTPSARMIMRRVR
jgi:hypothetical protein